MNANEEIVKEWLHICKKQFTLENIRFKINNQKKGSNYSDIDILSVDKNGNFYDYEIKWRSTYSLGATDKETVDSFIDQILKRERIEKIKDIIGNKQCKHIFVTTKIALGKNDEKRNLIIEKFNKRNIEVIFFEDIINELIENVKTKGFCDSPVLQIIRILKFYEIIK